MYREGFRLNHYLAISTLSEFNTGRNKLLFLSMNPSLLSTEVQEAKNKLSKFLGILSKAKKNRSIKTSKANALGTM